MPLYSLGFTPHHAPEEFLELPSFEDVARPLFSEPLLMEHFHGRHHGDPLELNFGPMPEDSALRLRWQVAHEVGQYLQQRFRPVLAREQGRKRQKARGRKLGLLRQYDPLAERTLHIIAHVLRGLPPTMRRLVERELEQNPHAFMALYSEVREIAEEHEKDRHREKRRAKAQERHDAPSEFPEDDIAAEELAAVLDRMRAGESDDADVLRFVELTANHAALDD